MTIIDAERIKMRFGRYMGFSLGEIAAKDVAYFDFLAGISLDAYLAEAVALLCEKHGRSVKVVSPKQDHNQAELFGKSEM